MTKPYTLEKGQIMSWPNTEMPGGVEACEIEVFSGELWVTFEGDLKDHVIWPGEKLALLVSGKTVIEALQDSVLSQKVQEEDLGLNRSKPRGRLSVQLNKF
jgi:hypothetical protein